MQNCERWVKIIKKKEHEACSHGIIPNYKWTKGEIPYWFVVLCKFGGLFFVFKQNIKIFIFINNNYVQIFSVYSLTCDKKLFLLLNFEFLCD